MPPRRRPRTGPDARTELRAWYRASLRPKLARAAAAGVVRPAEVDALDRQVRPLLDVRPHEFG